ncbi:protein ACCELERATED CELL DEATH 6-like [Lycium ferocissimum]|uniref:protein ACCELERATED CELL DEATH 6-like n=1 Tax=Lycium ferocissimum TaxID=112874 RepID=UPI00281695EA|nr:protein ACCELERATED CELL DEATH 6-like [Lycium ferocissimum]
MPWMDFSRIRWDDDEIKKRDDDEKESYNYIINHAAQMHLVVATLIVTVTFAAGFTLPGGFESDRDSPNKGMAILTRDTAFRAFVVTDAIAFVCSAGSVFSYFIMALYQATTKEERRVIINIYEVATTLQFLSMSAVVIAFITGLYATLAHSGGLAVTVCVIGCLFFLIYVLVFYLIIRELSGI